MPGFVDRDPRYLYLPAVVADVAERAQQVNSSAYVLTIKQEPGESKAVAKQEKAARGAKWPLDPPPVLELTIEDQQNQSSTFLHSPFWFCNVEIDVISHQGPSSIPKEKLLVGTTVSSLHRVKHNDRSEKGYFIFGDLNIRAAGTYRLKFSLFEMRQGNDGMFAEHLGSSVHTKQFQVHTSKYNLSLRESTALSKTLCEAGVKLRIRKEPTRRHRSGPVDWSNRQGYGGLHPQAALPAAVVQTPSQLSLTQTRAGEDITSRISLSNASLLDRSLLGQTPSHHSLSPSSLWHSSSTTNWAAAATRDHYDVPTCTTTPTASHGHSMADYANAGYNAAQYGPGGATTTPAAAATDYASVGGYAAADAHYGTPTTAGSANVNVNANAAGGGGGGGGGAFRLYADPSSFFCYYGSGGVMGQEGGDGERGAAILDTYTPV